jgi:hypothetical protein
MHAEVPTVTLPAGHTLRLHVVEPGRLRQPTAHWLQPMKPAVPAAHGTHARCSVPENEPAGHAAHDVLFGPEKKLSGQATAAPGLEHDEPAGQRWLHCDSDESDTHPSLRAEPAYDPPNTTTAPLDSIRDTVAPTRAGQLAVGPAVHDAPPSDDDHVSRTPLPPTITIAPSAATKVGIANRALHGALALSVVHDTPWSLEAHTSRKLVGVAHDPPDAPPNTMIAPLST